MNKKSTKILFIVFILTVWVSTARYAYALLEDKENAYSLYVTTGSSKIDTYKQKKHEKQIKKIEKKKVEVKKAPTKSIITKKLPNSEIKRRNEILAARATAIQLLAQIGGDISQYENLTQAQDNTTYFVKAIEPTQQVKYNTNIARTKKENKSQKKKLKKKLKDNETRLVRKSRQSRAS